MNNPLRLAFEQISREADRLAERWKSEQFVEKWDDYQHQMEKFINSLDCGAGNRVALVTFSKEGKTRLYFDGYYDSTRDCTIEFYEKDGVDYHSWSYGPI